MKVSVITLFPDIFEKVLASSILGRAQKKGLLEADLIDLRQFGEGPHKIVDDKPFGGGVGMVLKADILAKAWHSAVRDKHSSTNPNKLSGNQKTILMSASGIPYNQSQAEKLSKIDHLIIVCGHYEGVDQRFIDRFVDLEISIGDYVLTGGEVPAMVLVDSVTRLIPGVLEKEEATLNESYSIESLLEHPHYTRPQVFEGEHVPEILISGNHAKIEEWRRNASIERTKKFRPDLLKKAD